MLTKRFIRNKGANENFSMSILRRCRDKEVKRHLFLHLPYAAGLNTAPSFSKQQRLNIIGFMRLWVEPRKQTRNIDYSVYDEVPKCSNRSEGALIQLVG